jgi:periplasmic protein TonB
MQRTDPSLLDGSRSALGRAQPEQGPFAQIYGLDSPSMSRLVRATLLALALHSAVGLRGLLSLRELGEFARTVQQGVRDRIRQTIEIAVTPEPEPEPAPEPEPEPQAAPEPPPPKAPPPTKAPPQPRAAESPPPAPVAAQAGRVLTAEPDPDEPIDLTGNAFVQGNADSYAGGITASKGTASQAVRSREARADGAVGGTGKAAVSSVDRSRPAGTLQRNWDCPFPAEAELEQINYQQVNVAVTVADTGKPLDVKVLGKTTFGFGRAAQRCALGKTFVPALNRDGAPVTTTIPIVVTFLRR